MNITMVTLHSEISRSALFLGFILVFLVGTTTAATIAPSRPYAVVGRDFNFTCETDSPKNKVTWIQNNLMLSQDFKKCTGTDWENKKIEIYSFLCPSNTSFILVIPGSSLISKKRLSFECFDGNKSEPSIIEVYKEPNKDVQIFGYDTAGIKTNQNLTLRCSVDGGYPFANLTWSCNGSIVEGIQESDSTKVISVLNFPINKNHFGLICKCTATHPVWREDLSNQTKPLIVLYTPSVKPILSGYKSSQPIFENTAVNLTCAVPGGFPLTTLSWDCNGLRYTGKNESSAGEAKSVLMLSVNETYHQGQCVCRGTSTAGYNESAYVIFNVHYSAKFFDSSAQQVFYGELGKALTVRVQFYSNPEISSQENVTWYQDGVGKLSSYRNRQLEFDLQETTSLNSSSVMNEWTAIMVIKNLKMTNLGRYRLIVQNGPDMNSTFYFEIEQKIGEIFMIIPIICCALALMMSVVTGFAFKFRKKDKFRQGEARNSTDINKSSVNEWLQDTGFVPVGDENENPILLASGYGQVRDVVTTQSGPGFLYDDDGMIIGTSDYRFREAGNLIEINHSVENLRLQDTEFATIKDKNKNPLPPESGYGQVWDAVPTHKVPEYFYDDDGMMIRTSDSRFRDERNFDDTNHSAVNKILQDNRFTQVGKENVNPLLLASGYGQARDADTTQCGQEYLYEEQGMTIGKSDSRFLDERNLIDKNHPTVNKRLQDTGFTQVSNEKEDPLLLASGYRQARDAVTAQCGPEYLYDDQGMIIGTSDYRFLEASDSTDTRLQDTAFAQIKNKNENPLPLESGYEKIWDVVTGPEYSYDDDGTMILTSDCSFAHKGNNTTMENFDSYNPVAPYNVYAQVQKNNTKTVTNLGKDGKITDAASPWDDSASAIPEHSNSQNAVGVVNKVYNYSDLEFSPQTDQKFNVVGSKNTVEYANVVRTLPMRNDRNREFFPEKKEISYNSLKRNEIGLHSQRRYQKRGKPLRKNRIDGNF